MVNFIQLDFNLEDGGGEDEAVNSEQFTEAFLEFYKLFHDYGIIEKAHFKNINKGSVWRKCTLFSIPCFHSFKIP